MEKKATTKKRNLMMKSALIGTILVLIAITSYAGVREDYAHEGYAVIAKTRVDGEFEGCDFDKRIPLKNGLVFVCSSYSYTYGYMPEVLILKHVTNGDTKVLIKEREFRGKLWRR